MAQHNGLLPHIILAGHRNAEHARAAVDVKHLDEGMQRRFRLVMGQADGRLADAGGIERQIHVLGVQHAHGLQVGIQQHRALHVNGNHRYIPLARAVNCTAVFAVKAISLFFRGSTNRSSALPPCRAPRLLTPFSVIHCSIRSS